MDEPLKTVEGLEALCRKLIEELRLANSELFLLRLLVSVKDKKNKEKSDMDNPVMFTIGPARKI